MKILLTGATGFVGLGVFALAVRRGIAVRGALRKHGEVPGSVELAVVGEIDGATVWDSALRDVDVVIHLAARVHVMHENAANPLREFRKVNVIGTEHLARSAARCGVKRLVYVSSIKVNGESTLSPSSPARKLSSANGGRNIFTELDIPSPQDPYGISKWEAEQALHRVASETGLEIVIVRPPLVYGAGVKGNFSQMLKILSKGIPLPLASVNNQRSLVYVGNLVDALITCATHPDASGQTYLVSDGEDISTPELLRRLGILMHCRARLLSFPQGILKFAGVLVGKSGQIERLLGSLRVDSSKIRRELGWVPPYTLQQGLQETADWYRKTCL